jgi:hypothetical protein
MTRRDRRKLWFEMPGVPEAMETRPLPALLPRVHDISAATGCRLERVAGADLRSLASGESTRRRSLHLARPDRIDTRRPSGTCRSGRRAPSSSRGKHNG